MQRCELSSAVHRTFDSCLLELYCKIMHYNMCSIKHKKYQKQPNTWKDDGKNNLFAVYALRMAFCYVWHVIGFTYLFTVLLLSVAVHGEDNAGVADC